VCTHKIKYGKRWPNISYYYYTTAKPFMMLLIIIHQNCLYYFWITRMKHFEYYKISTAHLHNYNAFYDYGDIHRVAADVRVYANHCCTYYFYRTTMNIATVFNTWQLKKKMHHIMNPQKLNVHLCLWSMKKKITKSRNLK